MDHREGQGYARALLLSEKALFDAECAYQSGLATHRCIDYVRIPTAAFSATLSRSVGLPCDIVIQMKIPPPFHRLGDRSASTMTSLRVSVLQSLSFSLMNSAQFKARCDVWEL